MPNGAQYGQIQTSYKGTWVDQVLTAIGAPTTDSNRAALRAWAASEGTASSNNPLAFSGTYPGATTCLAQCGSSSPVMAYSSSAQGAQNTAQFLLGNKSYAGIVSAFRQDSGLSAIYQQINSSPWCKGCQGGAYPVALSKVAGVSGGTAFPSGASQPPGGVSLPVVGQILSPAEVDKFKGWFLMISGAVVGVVGLAVVLGSLGLESKVARTVAGVPGAKAVRSAARRTGSDNSESSGPSAADAESTRNRRQARQRSANPPPPSPAAAYRAGYDMGGRDENARREGQAANARNRRQSGPSTPGARRSTTEQRRAARGRVERSRANLTPEQRRQVDTF